MRSYTAHELARALLAAPDRPVEFAIEFEGVAPRVSEIDVEYLPASTGVVLITG